MNLLDKLDELKNRVRFIANECNCRVEHGADGAEHLLHIEKMLLAALVVAHEKEESEAVKADNSSEHDRLWAMWNEYAASKPSESCEQSETFDWRQAAILWGQGVELELLRDEGFTKWHELEANQGVIFDRAFKYRRKPSPATPDYSKDQGFKEGDIVMVKDAEGTFWHVDIYEVFESEKHWTLCESSWEHARPLTKSEYEKVRHE